MAAYLVGIWGYRLYKALFLKNIDTQLYRFYSISDASSSSLVATKEGIFLQSEDAI